MASKEERAETLLRRAVAAIDQAQYFDAAPERPEIATRNHAYTIRLLIHLRFHEAERMLPKGPLWAARPEHPYIKVEEVWSGNEQLVRYIYELADHSFGVREGFHFHVETDTAGRPVHHYTREEPGKRPVWRLLTRPTSIETALATFVETVWSLRS